jgi:hypothetical protein
MSDLYFIAHSCLAETCAYHVIAADWNLLGINAAKPNDGIG